MSDIDKVRQRLLRGEKLHMQFVADRRVWWFDQPHWVVPSKLMDRMLSDPHSPLREAGDSLFGLPRNSQTYLADIDIP